MDFEADKRRLRWACRRGMLELDMFLLPFFDELYDTCSEQEQSVFQSLLKESDTQIQAWLLKQEQPKDLQVQNLVDKIIAFASSKHSNRTHS